MTQTNAQLQKTWRKRHAKAIREANKLRPMLTQLINHQDHDTAAAALAVELRRIVGPANAAHLARHIVKKPKPVDMTVLARVMKRR